MLLSSAAEPYKEPLLERLELKCDNPSLSFQSKVSTHTVTTSSRTWLSISLPEAYLLPNYFDRKGK